MNTLYLWVMKYLTLSLGVMSPLPEVRTDISPQSWSFQFYVPMQTALPDNDLIKLSSADDTADKKSVLSKVIKVLTLPLVIIRPRPEVRPDTGKLKGAPGHGRFLF